MHCCVQCNGVDNDVKSVICIAEGKSGCYPCMQYCILFIHLCVTSREVARVQRQREIEEAIATSDSAAGNALRATVHELFSSYIDDVSLDLFEYTEFPQDSLPVSSTPKLLRGQLRGVCQL